MWADTHSGIKTTTVRIVDKCPDAFCGIDLGGLPARVLMGSFAGRYNGGWTFVSCDGVEGVSDGPPAIFVKEGSNPWWAIIQVRNPPARVLAINWEINDEAGIMAYASEAENFYVVPDAVRESTENIGLTIEYDFGYSHTVSVTADEITAENTLISL